jgi:TRAP-type uncharacterized transport system substrate-binding protein
MRVGSPFGVIATLLAIGISAGAHAAGPDWPKSLTLGTASPAGLYYDYGEAIAPLLIAKLGVPVNTVPAAAETIPENVARNTFLPFHRGAVRCYREIDINIPEALAAAN